MRKSTYTSLTFAALLLSAGGASLAATHYLVVPMPAKAAGPVEPELSVTLSPGVLPAAKRNTPYTYNFTPHVVVTGDPDYSAGNAVFSSAGPLPDGLTLQSDGTLSGAPTRVSSGQNFEIEATYKSQTGKQNFSLVVAGVRFEATKIATGAYHSCAITPQGAAKCWGRGAFGQLGNGSTQASTVPVLVSGLTANVTDIAVGVNHSCAVQSNAVFCWGTNSYGNLGNGGTNNSSTPVGATGLSFGATKVAAASHTTCAIQSGAMKCWGFNGTGQLGQGGLSDRLTPSNVNGLASGVSDISTSGSHTCAVHDSQVKCWGLNSAGQLGDNTFDQRLSPTLVTGLTSGATTVVAGTDHSCAVVSGLAYCWGSNLAGQLGNGDLGTQSSRVPLRVAGLGGGQELLAAGQQYNCAVDRYGAMYCWGAGSAGQLGTSTNENNPWPSPPVGLIYGVTSVSASAAATCATQDDVAMCWGLNAAIQQGANGPSPNRPAPVLE